MTDTTQKSSMIFQKGFGISFSEFVRVAEMAIRDGSPLALNKVLEMLPLLELDDGYTLDSYKYRKEYIKRSERRWARYQTRVYVRKKDYRGTYCPKLKKSFIERLLFKTPSEIHFSETIYSDELKIEGPLYTEECIKTIPYTINYISCPFTKEGVWLLFMYLIFINEWFGELVSSKESILAMVKPKDYSGGRIILPDDFKKIENLDLEPKVIISEEFAIVRAALQYADRINLYELKFARKSGRLQPIKTIIKKIAPIVSNEESVFMGRIR